jgi:hypothetical protein
MSRLIRSAAAGIVGSLLLAALSVTLPFGAFESANGQAADERGEFEPLTNAQSQGPSVYGHVATDGDGSFYAVQRVQLPVGQYISVAKSTDDGRTWQRIQLLQGTSGGATRPQLSVSGDYVAVAYIGSYCFPEQPSICSEAPYLAVSDNGGASFSGPRRLDQQAFDVQVAQDSDRTWVAWERGSTMELRMTFDAGQTWAVDRTVDRAVTGQLAAGDGVAVFSYFVNPTAPDEMPSTWALVADLDDLATTATPIEAGAGMEVAYPLDAAAGGGRVHVVTRSALRNSTQDDPPIVEVHSAGADGGFADRATFFTDPFSASIAATKGTVALAVGTVDGVTSVATSSNGGANFGELTPVASSADGAAPTVKLGLAVPIPDKPVARFSWSVPDRFVDQDGDGFVDPANDTGNVGGDSIRVWTGRQLEVDIDACASVAPEGRTITSYRWTELLGDGLTRPVALSGCSGTLEFEDGQRMQLRLDVTDSTGRTASVVQTVEPRDYVIASLGDSVASGEGNPHVPGTFGTPNPAIWQDRPCHRSVDAGPAVAAARLESLDPHSSVTFIQLACSGASVLDSPEVPGIDDPRTGGVIDEYDGQEPEPGSLRPSQVAQLEELLGLRQVDALLLSVGANDTRFSDTLKTCIRREIRCDTTSTRTDFEARLATLPNRFGRLDAALEGIGINPADVYITEYFDPAVDERGVTQMRCAVTGGLFDLLDDDEARWASTGVTGGLNSAVASAAATHGWNLVGGLAQAFRGHGYCSNDSWIVSWSESWARQSNQDGAFHPNRDGHQVYGDAIYRQLRSELLVPPPAPPAGVAVGPQALGPMMVLSATTDAITVTALRDTGGEPEILGSRLIDRVVSGPGGLGISSPPAVSSVAAVGSWTQLPRLGTTETEQLVAQLAVKPNVEVRTVEIMQAPRRERYLVTDRETTVLAILDATIDVPTDVTVQMQVTVEGSGPDDPGRPIASTTEEVRLEPGLNPVLLPAANTFELGPGEEPVATVTVIDPPGADPADNLDNTLSTDPDLDKFAIETRPLVAQMITTPVSGGEVTCRGLSEVTRVQVAFANEVLPVSGPGIFPLLACGDYPPIAVETEAGIIAYLNMLDALARRAQVDVIVSVVPGGWLRRVTDGAVGVAVPGRRAVMIEVTAPKMTLAHEIAHSFGVEHVEGTPQVTGVDVLRRRLMNGVDYMAERTPSKAWTGPQVWDALALGIGPPGGVPAPPAPPAPLPDTFEFGGTVDEDGNLTAAPPVPGNTGSPRGTSSNANLSRLTLEQTADGTVVWSEPAPLEEVGGLFAPDATDTGPLGWSYFVRTTLRPGVDGVQFRLDGEVVQQYEVAPAPEVTVTAPTATEVTARGRTLAVSWNTTAGPDARTTVLGSQDGGLTFKPLAIDVTGTSVDIVVPRDVVDGPMIVRLVVQDGMVAGQADSAPFIVEPRDGVVPEQVVAVRHDVVDLTTGSIPPYPGRGIYTMNPDGTDFTEIVPMVPPGPGEPGMVPLHPDWSPDASRIAFDGEVGGRRDLYVVDPDGSNRRRITDATSRNGNQFVCADWHPDGRDLLSLAAPGFGQQDFMQLVVVDSETGAVRQLGGWGSPSVFFPPWDIPCPRWSGDGNEILLAYEDRPSRGGGVEVDIFVLDVATLNSKYAYSVNPGTIESVAKTTWLNFAPGNDDKFAVNQRLFSSGYLMTAALRDVQFFFTEPVTVPMPRPEWSIENVSPINDTENFGSVGYTDADDLWFTSTNRMFPRHRRQLSQFNFQFWYSVTTDTVGHFCRMPTGGTAATCYLPGGDGTPVDAVSVDSYRLDIEPPGAPVPAAPIRPGTPTVGIIQADMHPEIVTEEPTPPIVVPDPDTVPADPDDPPPSDVDTPAPEAPPAPGADDRAPEAAPSPRTTTYVVPADGTTPIVLRDADGLPVRAAITRSPLAGTAVLRAATPTDGDPLLVGADGTVLVDPAAGFAGSFTFEAAAPGGTPVTMMVDVVAPPTPTAVDDTITVDAGSRVVIEPGTLLANDVAPESVGLGDDELAPLAPGQLEIVSVFGYTGGRATLLDDGSIEVETTSPTGGTFDYVAGVTGSTGTSAATVRVRITGAPDPTSGLRFEPVQPDRLLDTRRAAPVAPGTTVEVVVAGRGGVPADTTAVSLSVTAVQAWSAGYLTVFPCGADRPPTSNVNFGFGDTVANAVTVPVGVGGAVCVYTDSRTDLLVDVNGHWSSAGSGRFTPVPPTRLVDTRSGARVPARSVTRVDVSPVVPVEAAAAAVNLTAVDATAAGYLTVFPCGAPQPNTSNLNVRTGGTVAVSVIAGRGADGGICVYSSVATDLVVDVSGWLGATGVGSLDLGVPSRLLDTRQGAGRRPGAGSVTRVEVSPGATGELLNVAAVDPVASTFLTVFPCGTVPTASNVNTVARQNRANQVVVGATGGEVCVYTQASTHLVIDRVGRFGVPVDD